MDDNRRERIITALALGGLTLLGIGLLCLIFWPLFVGEKFEFYIRLFLGLFAINTFANLRSYNAVVQNTRFTIKLRESLEHIRQQFPTLDRAFRQLQQALGSNKTSLDSLNKTQTTTGNKIQELTESINKIKQKQQHDLQN